MASTTPADNREKSEGWRTGCTGMTYNRLSCLNSVGKQALPMMKQGLLPLIRVSPVYPGLTRVLLR